MLRSWVRGWYRRVSLGLLTRLHRGRLRSRVAPADPEYSRYLEVQLRRSLLKSQSPSSVERFSFVDVIRQRMNLDGKSILCVGCRDSGELREFRRHGAGTVIGIDLFSRDDDIRIMDMHAMDFASGSFDLVYSCHSLEHALLPEKAFAEFLRVAKPDGIVAVEVPVEFQTDGTDLCDFQTVEGFCRTLGASPGNVSWSQKLEADDDRNDRATPILRVTYRKPAEVR